MNSRTTDIQLSHSPRATGDDRSCITGEPEVGHRSPPINASGKPKADLPFSDPEIIRTVRQRQMRDSSTSALARATVMRWLSCPDVRLAYTHARTGAPTSKPVDEATYATYREMFSGWVATGTELPDWPADEPPPNMLVQSCLNQVSFSIH